MQWGQVRLAGLCRNETDLTIAGSALHEYNFRHETPDFDPLVVGDFSCKLKPSPTPPGRNARDRRKLKSTRVFTDANAHSRETAHAGGHTAAPAAAAAGCLPQVGAAACWHR